MYIYIYICINNSRIEQQSKLMHITCASSSTKWILTPSANDECRNQAMLQNEGKTLLHELILESIPVEILCTKNNPYL